MKTRKINFWQRLKKNTLRISFFVIFTLLLSVFPAPNIYFKKIPESKGLDLVESFNLPPPPVYPANYKSIPPPYLSAQGVLVQDIASGVILYAKNEKVRFPPASTTKIFTALVALDQYNLDDEFVVKTIVSDGRKMDLVLGEKISVESLLYGALVHSANDAAYTLAENYPGGVEKFVDLMNQKAKSLYLSDTHFTNTIGFDDPNHYTTAKDLTKQAIAGLRNKTFAKIVSTKSITVSDVSYTYFHELKNVNQLLGTVSGVAGVKTGFTEFGGEILVTEVKKNGRSVLFVLLKSSDRFGETVQLINWVFGNFIWLPISEITPVPQSFTPVPVPLSGTVRGFGLYLKEAPHISAGSPHSNQSFATAGR